MTVAILRRPRIGGALRVVTVGVVEDYGRGGVAVVRAAVGLVPVGVGVGVCVVGGLASGTLSIGVIGKP